MEDRLRECPRCRSEQTSLHDYHGEVAPICWKCKLSGPYLQTPDEAIEWWNSRATDQRCKCDMRTSLVGDGCRYCNPQYYIDMLEEQAKEDDTDPLLGKMAEALEEIIRCLSHGLQDTRASLTAKKALQEYREMKDANTSS